MIHVGVLRVDIRSQSSQGKDKGGSFFMFKVLFPFKAHPPKCFTLARTSMNSKSSLQLEGPTFEVNLKSIFVSIVPVL